jgi:predicted O-methyltransferase YrrM
VNRFSTDYVKCKAVHSLLRTFVHPPAELFSRPGYLHALEGKFLYWLATQVPAGGQIVEVGSFKGKSSGFLAAGLNRGGSLACVDTWSNDAMPYDEPADTLSEFLRNMSRYRDSLNVCRGLSAEVAAGWSRPVDLLFIDGDHSYEGCSADLTSWLPYVRCAGWIAFHDSSVDGVSGAIRDFYPRSMRYSERRAWSIFAARKR